MNKEGGEPVIMNKANYEAFSKEACDAYLSSDGEKTIEDAVADIALREELNPQEIARICQMANTKVFLLLFKSSDDKTFEFPVADPESVIARLGAAPASEVAPKVVD